MAALGLSETGNNTLFIFDHYARKCFMKPIRWNNASNSKQTKSAWNHEPPEKNDNSSCTTHYIANCCYLLLWTVHGGNRPLHTRQTNKKKTILDFYLAFAGRTSPLNSLTFCALTAIWISRNDCDANDALNSGYWWVMLGYVGCSCSYWMRISLSIHRSFLRCLHRENGPSWWVQPIK